MADTIREKIENAGEAAKDTAKKAGEKVKDGADTVAEKTANAAKSAGQAVKDAGQKLKDKSGS
ncbi:CsbD family protein [Frigoriglobus tundricola]|nr:CsbD family protein [Frigoriglobus tundricola]